jgi:hypothetical protein
LSFSARRDLADRVSRSLAARISLVADHISLADRRTVVAAARIRILAAYPVACLVACLAAYIARPVAYLVACLAAYIARQVARLVMAGSRHIHIRARHSLPEPATGRQAAAVAYIHHIRYEPMAYLGVAVGAVARVSAGVAEAVPVVWIFAVKIHFSGDLCSSCSHLCFIGP